jgi:hypothetical protein
MKFKIGAGAEFDTLTKEELADALRAWHVEVVKGARPRTFEFSATIATNAVTIGGDTADTRGGLSGPTDGFVWAVSRITQTGLAIATDPTSIFLGTNQPGHLVFPNFTGTATATGYKHFSKGELVLLPKQRICVASTGAIGSAGVVTISGAAWELPIGMLWQLV